jgi:hypothetical protein
MRLEPLVEVYETLDVMSIMHFDISVRGVYSNWMKMRDVQDHRGYVVDPAVSHAETGYPVLPRYFILSRLLWAIPM